MSRRGYGARATVARCHSEIGHRTTDGRPRKIGGGAEPPRAAPHAGRGVGEGVRRRRALAVAPNRGRDDGATAEALGEVPRGA